MKYLIETTFIIILCLLFSACDHPKTEKPLNVLFIAIDDLRPELGCYGNEHISSPHLDKLASEGFLLSNHITQVPTCGASRYSLLTGMRPKGREYLNNNIFEKVVSHKEEEQIPESFIHHLKRNGYHTVGIGKISHSADGYLYGYEDSVSTVRELPHSWDELLFNPGKWETGWNAFFAYANGENRQSLKKQVRPYEKGNVNDNGYPDGLSAQLAIDKLKAFKQSGQQFFLGVGFFKPHLPFTAPEQYWNLYNRDSIPVSPNPFAPQSVHPASLHNSGEFNQYQLGDEAATLDHPVSVEYAQKLRHAYFACISYIDHQVGRIIDTMKALEMEENTMIVVWGDHGWHLGDQQMWGKHSLFENALRSTLIMKVPFLERKNKVIGSIVETVDIYPTILELTNTPVQHHIDGQSFVHMLTTTNDLPENEVAYGYFKNGITLRTNQYRLTKYYREAQPNIELYDHYEDKFETKNIAQENPDIVKTLMPILEKGNNNIYE